MLDTETWRLLYFYYEFSSPYRAWNVYEMAWPDADKIMGHDHTYSYADMTTTVTDYSGDAIKSLMYQFNDFGNVVCVRDELGYASYSKYSTALLPNHPEQVSKLQRSVINLLPDHDFETGGYWSTALNGGTGTFSYATDQKYLGSKAMKMVKTNADGNMCVYMNYANLTVGQSYTLSGYIRSTGSIAGYAAVHHGENWFNGAQVTPGSEWTRVSATFTATSTSATLYFIAVGTGTLWLDAAQFEEGCVVNRYNLIRNGDFSMNSSGVPTFWTANGSNDSDDEIIATEDWEHPTFLHDNVMRIYGDPQTNKGIYQDLPISGSEGDVYVASGWARGYSRPIGDDPRRFGIRVAFKNSSGTRENADVLSWNEEWTNWQYISGAVIAPCDYTAIRFNVDYEENLNYADFDGFALYKEEFGNTFAYDEDGNVTAVKDLASKQASAEYDDYNNLISYVQPGRPDDVKTTIGYGSTDAEKKMRLPRQITTPTNIRTNNLYDNNGNLTQTTVIDIMDGTCAIITGSSYSSDGNHLIEETDTCDKKTSFVMDLDKDTLTSVTTHDGNSVNYEYDERKRLKKATTSINTQNHCNTYTYSSGRLASIGHNTTGDSVDVIYSFEYDEFGNPTAVSVAQQSLVSNVYSNDGARVLKRIEFGNGGKVHYTRDEFRRVTGIYYDNATTPRFSFEYGANGKVAYVHDNELNRTIWTEYDSNERPIRCQMFENATSNSLGNVGYANTSMYNEYSQVSKSVEKCFGNNYETDYTYDLENHPTQVRYGADNRRVVYTYDPIGRINKRTVTGNSSYETNYSFVRPDPDDDVRSSLFIESISQNGQNYTYTYDDRGNISSEARNGLICSFVYDEMEQLIRVNDPHSSKSIVMEYDRGGNILSSTEYAYTTGTLGLATKVVNYVYSDENWKDKLTAYDGKTITYDEIGNPTAYDGWAYAWEAGRILKQMNKDDTIILFTYDHGGLRVSKNANGTVTRYVYNGTNLVHMMVNNDDLHFFYDARNKPAMVRYNGVDYFYIYNLMGDVVALIDSNGNQVVEYKYDAWGKPVSVSGAQAGVIGYLNPFRYRAYVFDEETGLYYLKNRYYNPEWKRFLNEDNALFINTKYLSGYNLFAYCLNNPINMKDPTGMGPNLIDELFNRVKHTAKILSQTLLAPLKAISASAAWGVGLGVEGRFNIANVFKPEVAAKNVVLDRVGIEKGSLYARSEQVSEVSIAVTEHISASASSVTGHSYNDPKCTCNVWKDSFNEKMDCPANATINSVDTTLEFGAGLFVGIGAEISLEIDLKVWEAELERIHQESVSYKSVWE